MRMKEAYLDENRVRISTVTGKPVRTYAKKSASYWGAAIKSVMDKKAKKNALKVPGLDQQIVNAVIERIESQKFKNETPYICGAPRSGTQLSL